MKSILELKKFLQNILEVQFPKRIELIKELQNEIWNDKSIKNEKLNEILSELAYDLDFYEPNEQLKQESSSYYGEERLCEIIKSGIIKLEEFMNIS